METGNEGLNVLGLLLEAAGKGAEIAPLSGASFAGISFLVLAVITLFSAFLVVTQKDIVRAATALFITLASVSGLYLFLGAEFLAFVQIMVYVGGTTVLIMFGVMLTAREPVEIARGGSARAISGAAVVGLIAVPLLAVLLGITPGAGQPQYLLSGDGGTTQMPQSTRNLGDMLLTSYIAPFVIASFVLLIALVGAAYLVRRREEPRDSEPDEELAYQE